MKKTWIALLLALCCMLTTLGAASACCTGTSGMDETQTMEETCPCMMDGMRADGCMCEKQCACENECACAEKKLEMLTTEMNAVFEKNMDLWNRFFGMMDKQPDMDMNYADYLTEELEMMKEKFTEEEYGMLQQDIETIRGIDEQISKLEEMYVQAEAMTSNMCMTDGQCAPECDCEAGACTGDCDCMKDKM